LTDSIYLYDSDGEMVASSYDTDVQYVGYPFDGLSGKTGPFSVYAKGSDGCNVRCRRACKSSLPPSYPQGANQRRRVRVPGR
jgi:hypothetical protein